MRLPSISERKSLYLLESKCKQRPVPSDGFQPKSLNKIFSEYVLPSIKSRGETPDIEFKESLNRNKKVHSYAKKSFTASQSVSILHDNLVYSSARDSHAIVCKNKQVYEKMQRAMKAAERKELHAALLSCKEQQRLLKLLTQHTRVEQTEEAKGTSAPHSRGGRVRKRRKQAAQPLPDRPFQAQQKKVLGRYSFASRSHHHNQRQPAVHPHAEQVGSARN